MCEAHPTHRVVEQTPLRLAFWMVLAAVFMWAGLDQPYHVGKNFDWFLFTHHIEVARRTWALYGQLPAWNPYLCGGIPGLGNLQASSVAPMNLWTSIFGTLPGLKLGIWSLFVLGQEGTYQYARRHGIKGVGAVVAAAAFCFHGRFAQTFFDGHPIFFGFLLSPWVFLGFERGLTSWWWGVGGGVFMGWILAKGGAVPTPMTAVMLAAMMVFYTGRALADRQEVDYAWYRPALTVGWMALVTCTVWGVRTLPVIESALIYPREWSGSAGNSFAHLAKMLFEQTNGLPRSYHGKATNYVGPYVLALALFAVLRREKAGGRMLLFAGVAWLLAMAGEGPFGLYDIVTSLPVLDDLRAYFRYTTFVAFFLAVGAGAGVASFESGLADWVGRLSLEERVGNHPAVRVGLESAVVLLVSGATVAVGYYAVRPGFEFNKKRVDKVFKVEGAQHVRRPFHQGIGNRWHAHVWPAISRGSLACWEAQPFFQSPALRADLKREEFLAEPDAGRVERLSWSPHHIVLKVSLDRATRLIVNQNRSRGWGSTVGEVTSDRGRLAVDLPAGSHRVVLEFSDPVVNAGIGLSAVSMLLLVGAAGRRRRWW